MKGICGKMVEKLWSTVSFVGPFCSTFGSKCNRPPVTNTFVARFINENPFQIVQLNRCCCCCCLFQGIDFAEPFTINKMSKKGSEDTPRLNSFHPVAFQRPGIERTRRRRPKDRQTVVQIGGKQCLSGKSKTFYLILEKIN